jgi:hypothetical protein
MLKSLYNNRIGIMFVAFSAFFVATGQLYWKIGTQEGIFYLGLGFFLISWERYYSLSHLDLVRYRFSIHFLVLTIFLRYILGLLYWQKRFL